MIGFYKEDYLEKSLYYNQLKNVFEIFPKKNVHIIITDEIKKNPRNTIVNLYSFLGVDKRYIPSSMMEKINFSKTSIKAPNKIWSYLNKTLVHNQRYVGGVNFGKKIGNI